jgi:hypothetical protein
MATGLIQEAANLPSINPRYKYGFMSRTTSRDSADSAASDTAEVLRRSRSCVDTTVGGVIGGGGASVVGGRSLQRSDPALSRHMLQKSHSAHGKLLLRTFLSACLCLWDCLFVVMSNAFSSTFFCFSCLYAFSAPCTLPSLPLTHNASLILSLLLFILSPPLSSSFWYSTGQIIP